MNISLYQCEREISIALDAALDRETGEIVSSEDLDNAVGQFKNKGMHVVAYILNRRALSAARKAHIAAIDAIEKADTKKDAALVKYLSSNMANAGIARIDALDGTFSAQLFSGRDEAIEIEDNAPVDARFARIVPARTEWDKAALKKAIKNAEPVPSCVTLVRRDRLTIV